MNIEELDAKRFLFLSSIYDANSGDIMHFENIWELGKKLGMEDGLTDRIVRYLNSADLLKYMACDEVMLTVYGFETVEAARRSPSEPTDHFPPLNVINIEGNVYGSAIMQGNTSSSQTAHMDTGRAIELSKVIEEIGTMTDQFQLGPEKRKELETDLVSVSSQLGGPRPKKAIVKECLISIRGILEESTASIASTLLERLAGF